MCALHGKSHLACLFLFYIEDSFHLALTLYFESLYFSGFERKERVRELLYVFFLEGE